MTAARTGKSGPVKALLARGADVNAKGTARTNRADVGGRGWSSAVVELLIKAGADFRTPLPDSGFTPLFFAAREGRDRRRSRPVEGGCGRERDDAAPEESLAKVRGKEPAR